jgi:DNA-binding SARP family transcriptional activator
MASATLRIRLLGGLDLRQGEVALPPLGSARAESLLALLLLHQEAAQPRQRLAFLLWPDSSEGQARTNLRHLLHVLRRALPEPDRFLEVTPRTLRWRPDAPCWLDVAAFDAALARSERDPGGSEAALSEAVELYAGDLLQGSYDEWLAEERERLRQRYLQALERLVELLEARVATSGSPPPWSTGCIRWGRSCSAGRCSGGWRTPPRSCGSCATTPRRRPTSSASPWP